MVTTLLRCRHRYPVIYFEMPKIKRRRDFIPEGLAEISQTFLRDTNIIPK
jgi:hypothetical protein